MEKKFTTQKFQVSIAILDKEPEVIFLIQIDNQIEI